MKTTDEIMTLAHEYADAASEAVYEDLHVTATRNALRAAIDDLVKDNASLREANAAFGKRQDWWNEKMFELEEKLKWARHLLALLTEADSLADLAGVARPGAEPVAYLYHDAKKAQDAHPLLHSTLLVMAADRRQGLRGETPLYTQPAQQPLTQPEKQRLWNDAMHANRSSTTDAAMEYGSAIEVAHGITQKETT